MNAYYLHKPDGSRAGYCACGECGQLALDANWDISEKCCTCYECKRPLAKEERYARNIIHCRECDVKLRKQREQAQLDKAELVEDYAGPVYFEGGHGSYGDGYFSDVDELVEWLESDDERSVPEFAFCCEVQDFPGIDLGNVLENLCEEMHEDAQDDLNGVDELQQAVNTFNAANKNLTSWYVDTKRKVRTSHKQEATNATD